MTAQPSEAPPDRPPATGAAAAPNLNTLWARVLVDELARAGLRHVCISPGSRSAPLVFAFAEHPDIVDHSIVDERSSAFFALGLARALGEPVALLCTSGTAAANFLPAICESGRDRIPLLVLTGARPPEDHDCGVQQVMDQHHLYGRQVRAFHALPQPEVRADKLAALRSLLDRALALTRGPEPGPVHLDIPFRKPLEPVDVAPDHPDRVPTVLDAGTEQAIDGRPERAPWLRIGTGPASIDEPALECLADWIGHSRRALLIAGADVRGPGYREALRDFAEHAGIPVFAEPASGLRHWRERGDNTIAAADLLAATAELKPDLLLYTGSAPLNWAMQDLSREPGRARHVVISDSPALADPNHRASLQIIGSPAVVFESLRRRVPEPALDRRHWLDRLRRRDVNIRAMLNHRLDPEPALSAPAFWHRLGGHLPEHAALLVSSSMVVRDLDCFMATANQTLEVHFNRGLNGIDGVVSTALGVAMARRAAGITAPTVLVIGDVALRHDLGALPLAGELGLDLTVIVLDNDGGEIFDYLPSAEFDEVHRRHFVTERGRPITGLIPRSIPVLEPSSPASLDAALRDTLGASGLHLVRVQTHREHDQRLRAALVESALHAPDPGDATPAHDSR